MHNPIFHDISNRIYTIAKRGIAVILTGVMVVLMSLGTSGASAALTVADWIASSGVIP